MLPDSDAGIQRGISLVQEMVSILRARADRAENRAAIVLGAAGVLAGLVVGFSSYLRDSTIEGWWLLVGLAAATLLLLTKAVLYGLWALDALRGCELSPEAALELSGLEEKDAARAELADRVWEYYQLLSVANARLYYSQRSQTNFAFAVVAWGATAIGSFGLSQDVLELPPWWAILVAFALVVAATILDVVIERKSQLWKWQK